MSLGKTLIPDIDADIKPFYDGLLQHRFLLMRCQTCGAWYWPAAYCRFHPNKPFMSELEWAEASGRGTVATFNIHRTAPNLAFRDKVPYVIAMVQLEEGPMFGSTIVECRPEEVYVGMPVQVVYDDVEPDLTLARFRPAQPAPRP